MKKVFLLLTAFTASFLIGCSDDETQEGLVGPNGSYVGFAARAQVETYTNDIPDAEISTMVSLVSYQNESLPNNNIDITWSYVDPVDYLDPADFETQAQYDAELATFAELGTEFDMPNGQSGTVTIASGETFAQLPNITIHPVTFDPNAAKKFVLGLMSADGGVVAEQYRYVVITLQGVCASNLAGNYNLVVTQDGATVYNLPGETVSSVSGTRYQGRSIGPYNDRGLISANAQIAGAYLVFDDVCNAISLWKDPDYSYSASGVPDGQAQYLGPYGNAVYQTSAQAANSFVDENTGVITVVYHIWFSAATREYVGVYTPI